MGSRGLSAVAPTAADDASSAVYRWIWRPMLALQLVHYTWLCGLALADPGYRPVGDPADPTLHENHIGLWIHLQRQPHVGILGVHLLMAWAWLAAVPAQKALVAAMARAAQAGDERAFLRVRAVHAAIGTAMCLLAFVGIAIAPVLALIDRERNAAALYLVALPAFFLPAFALTAYTARTRRVSVRWHRFWAEITFVGPALSSLWSEVIIYVLGRTSMGPVYGEIVGTQAAAVLGLLLVVAPAWRSLQRGLAADTAQAPSQA
jgi:hypothetical protein